MTVCGSVPGVGWSRSNRRSRYCTIQGWLDWAIAFWMGWPETFPMGPVDHASSCPYRVTGTYSPYRCMSLSWKHVIKQHAWADAWTGPGAEAGRRDGLVECTQWSTSRLFLHLAPIGRSSQGKRLAAHQTFPPAYHGPPQRFCYCTRATQTGCNRRIQPTIVTNSPNHAPLARLKWAEPTSALLYLSKRCLTVGGLPNILNATDWQ